MTDYSVDEVMFSCISGYNYYTPVKDITEGAVHIPTGTIVTVLEDSSIDDEAVEKKWRHFVQMPADARFFKWPVDVVKKGDGCYALVFRMRAYPNLKPLKELLYQESLLDWQSPEIKKLSTSFLKAMISLNQTGYAYHNFDIWKMYYNTNTYDVTLEFSDNIGRYIGHHYNGDMASEPDDLKLQKKGILRSETTEHIGNPIEFMPPWVDEEGSDFLTLNDDYYSVTALLFRLFTGRMPYQGRQMDMVGKIMDYMIDTDVEDHLSMFRFYHDHPIFIFDEKAEEKNNSIGHSTHEYVFIERYRSLPVKIQDMFYASFVPPTRQVNRYYREHYITRTLYSPEEWLQELKKEGVL